MPTILRLCERAILLERGRVVADGNPSSVVDLYLSGGHGSSAYRTWDETEAPGNDLVRLRSVRVVDRAGETAETADVQHQVGVEIGFDVLRQGAPITPTIALFNEQGVHVFNALDPSPRWSTPAEPGSYRSVAWIPAQLLNEGRLLVSVFIVSLGSGKSDRHVDGRDVVAFSTVDPGGEGSAKGTYTQQWAGAVSPLLDWSLERVRSHSGG